MPVPLSLRLFKDVGYIRITIDLYDKLMTMNFVEGKVINVRKLEYSPT